MATRSDYAAGLHYEAGTLEFLQFGGGRVIDVIGTAEYQYLLTDHQGNTRAVWKTDGTLDQTADYYPFGLLHTDPNAGGGSPQNQYLFQGQEHQPELGWVQFKWRNSDSAIGRFFNIDPLSEDYLYNSTYAFSENKPINGVDFLGLSWVPVYDDYGHIIRFAWTDEEADPSKNIFALAVLVKDFGTFDEGDEFNLGSAQITIYGENEEDVFTVDGTSLPARPQEHATLAEGLHHFMLGFHKQTSEGRYLALRAFNFEAQPVNYGYHPKNGGSTAHGLNVHSALPNGKTGLTSTGLFVSEGCILVDCHQFSRVIDTFDKTTIRERARSNILQQRTLAFGVSLAMGLTMSHSTEINPAPYWTRNGNGILIFLPSPLPNPVIGLAVNRASNVDPLPNIGQSVWNNYTFPLPQKN